MKKSLFYTVVFSVLLAGCASNPSTKATASHDSDYLYKENARKDKKLQFEDWKYKGFGQPLPDWFEAAYKGDIEEVRRKTGISENYKIEIITASGINSDQANKSLWQRLFVMSQLGELYDSTWVLLDEKQAAANNNSYPYYAVAVILIDNKQE